MVSVLLTSGLSLHGTMWLRTVFLELHPSGSPPHSGLTSQYVWSLILCIYFTGPRGTQILGHHYSGCFYMGVSGMRLTFTSDWVKQIAFLDVVGLTQQLKGWIEQKGWPSPQVLLALQPVNWDIGFSCFLKAKYQLCLGLRSQALDQDYTIGSSGSPACWIRL